MATASYGSQGSSGGGGGGGGGGGSNSSAPLTGDGSSGTPFTVDSAKLSGISIASGTLINNLTSGIAGGQTIVGGTAASDGLTISTTGNATKGKVTIGSSTGIVLNEATNVYSAGVATPKAGALAHYKGNANNVMSLYLQQANAGASAQSGIDFGSDDAGSTGAHVGLYYLGTGYTPSGNFVPGSAYFIISGGSGNVIYRMFQGSGRYVWTTTTSDSERLAISNAGSVSVGVGVATTATDGFLYIPSCAGPPTGVPTSLSGGAVIPLCYDRTNNKMYVYNGGWKGGITPGVYA